MPSSVTFLIQENSNSSLEQNHMLEYSSDESDDQDQRIERKHLADQGEAILLEMQENAQENKKSLDIDLFSPDELETNIPNPQPSSTSPIRTRRPVTSKIPVRTNSRSPTQSRQISSSGRSNGAFQFFTPRDDRKRLASSDDDDAETNQLKEEELKRKLREQKKHGRKTGELLNQLHDNYEELLEKYAQAENTIDQLRFQPKILGDNTPRSVTSEHYIHLTQPAQAHRAALRSSGAYRSTTGSPLSSIRPVNSTTTTTTTPARKSVSPAYSGTIESIVFDEVTPEKFKVQLVIDTQALAEKMKTFLTLMDENQLNLAEQKQVYENIRQDYERLLKDFDQKKRNGQLDVDLTQELESMKQLLKEIVNKITQNLLGKSSIESSPERVNNDVSHSSQLSARSSLCNHTDLMNQYEKLLHAVNTTTQPQPIRSELNNVPTHPKTQQSPTKSKTKPYVYVSGDSDDEQEDERIAPIPYTRGVQSTSLELDYVPSTSVKHHQHRIEERRYENHSPKRNGKELRYSSNRTYEYDSGVGTNNLTKISRESKISPSTANESHFPSLDDDEQESISSTSSSTRSSDSGSASSRSPYRYDKREKPSGHSNSRLSNTDTPLTGSFDPLPPPSHKKKNMHRSHHTWKPQKNVSPSSHQSRLTPIYRSTSIEPTSIGEYRTRSSHRSPTVLQIASKMKNNPPKTPVRYQSSIFIDQTHTNRKSPERLQSNLYLDPETGIVYRYESDAPRIHHYQPSPTRKLYECGECGAITTYHHRHHIKSSIKRVPVNVDDQGYESGTQRRSRKHRYIELDSSSSSSSDSDSELSPTYQEMLALNRAYNRAENIRHQSRYLSRYIIRQLKLTLATL